MDIRNSEKAHQRWWNDLWKRADENARVMLRDFVRQQDNDSSDERNENIWNIARVNRQNPAPIKKGEA